MLLYGLEIPPLFATLAVLLDNCSSLFDCWDTLGAAAAAAVGAGAAAVFVGGLLLSPGEAPGIVEEGAPPQVAASASGPQPTLPGGAPTTVAQAPPQAAPTGVQPQVPPQVAPQAPPQAPPQATAPTAPTAPTVPQGTPVFGGDVQPGSIAASAPASPGAPAPAFEAPPVGSQPTAPAAPPASPPVAPPVAPPVVPPAADTALAAGLAAGVAPVVSTLKAVLGSRASGSGAGSDAGQDDGDQDDLDTCPEADASLFGLSDINTRQDCPGTRPGMPPNYAGLDFTSNDDHGRPLELPFEAGVTGEVTYVGGAFNSVQVTLDNGNRIQFLHASQVLVQAGQQVEPTTVLGRTGGTGPYGPNQYEIHLHVQAFDRHGDLIDPDCALSGGENRRLRRNVVPPETQPTAAPPEAPREAFPTPGATAVLSGMQPLPYVPQVPVEPPQMPIQAAPPQAPVGLLCTRCGNTSPANARFCPYCGQTFAQAVAPAPPPVAPPAPPQTIYCGNCGQANTWGSVYCGRCGARLSY